MKSTEERALLEQAIEVCRDTIAEKRQIVRSAGGTADATEATRLLSIYEALLASQLKRRDDLLGS